MLVNYATRLKLRHFVAKLQFKSANEVWIKMAQDAEWSVKMCTYQEKSLSLLFTLYRIAFAHARKPYRIRLLFKHKNGDFGAISEQRSNRAKLRSADL